MKKIYIVGGNRYMSYLNWILPLGFEITDKLEDSLLVFFCGGEDVCPSIYNHSSHPSTYYNLKRDKEEKEIFDEAVRQKKYLWGCCRGSQALCAFQKGGYLIQDASHPGRHLARVADTQETLVLTSTHHQMAAPFDINHRLLVYAENLSPYHYLGDGRDIKVEKEPEITYYPDIKGVGSQSHVEYQYGSSDAESLKTVKYHQELLSKLVSNEL